MPNPLSSITSVFNLLSEEIKILPATGGAVEDLLPIYRHEELS